jgi:hypothetical protein
VIKSLLGFLVLVGTSCVSTLAVAQADDNTQAQSPYTDYAPIPPYTDNSPVSQFQQQQERSQGILFKLNKKELIHRR